MFDSAKGLQGGAHNRLERLEHLFVPGYYLAPHRGRARYCNAHVCVFVCLCVCLFVRVFAKFQSVISQPFLNRSLRNLAYILRMGTP